MTEFTRSDSASIAEFERATRTALEYEMVPAWDVGDKIKKGWKLLTPIVAMVPPEYRDDERQ